jgi:hypothetical protein
MTFEGPLPDFRVKPVMLVTETEYPAFARKAKTQELLSAGVVPHPPLPPIALLTPAPEATILEPRVSCVAIVKLLFTVVALLVTGAHVLLVLRPVVSHPTNRALVATPPPPDGRIVIVRLVLPTPTEFEAEMVTTFVPAVWAAPEITPLVVLMVAHPGKLEAPKEVGEFDAVI